MRFYTIEAENIEELKKKYEENENQNICVNKYSLGSQKEEENFCNNNTENNLNFQDEYQGYDKINDYSDDEFNENDDINQEDILKESSSEDEKNLELLCLYLKQSIALMTNKKYIRNTNIFYRCKNPIQTFSGNAIYDLNIKELFDDITSENDIKSNEDQSSRSNSLKEFIIQNIKGDFTLKIMIGSNNDYIRKLFVNKFLNLDNNYDYIDESDFEIRRQQIRLFNKSISLQIFDTSDIFHKHKFSKLYYQFSNGFFIFIEATNHNANEYLENFFKLTEEYIKGKTIVIFGVNMLFENNCTIDGFDLKEFALRKNCIFIPIKLENFSIRNSIIIYYEYT